MFPVHQSGPPNGLRRGAFTLIEIIVAMTIIAVITAVAVPTLKGLHAEEKVRAPLGALAEMVQEVRLRAMQGRRPYEIIFERAGLHAIPGNRPFAKREEFIQYLEALRTPPPITTMERETALLVTAQKNDPVASTTLKPIQENPSPAAARPGEATGPELPWTLSIALEGGMKCEVLMWGDGEWESLEGDGLRRWVFQPNGMANPARVRLITGNTGLEAGFDLLTGEMTGERSWRGAAPR